MLQMGHLAEGAVDVNRAYYGRTSRGRDDYWRKMAAPRHRVRVLLDTLARLAPRSVVDLGCGNGVMLEEIRARLPATRLAGVDLSVDQIADNQRLLPWASWHAANLELPLDPSVDFAGQSDAALATEVVEHLDRPERLLENALALVRPGGHLLLSTQSGPVHETERRVGHRRHYTAVEMSDLLTRVGWQVERAWNTGFPFHDLSKWYANIDPEGSMVRFGSGAYGWKEDLVCRALRLAFSLNSHKRGAQLFALARKPT
jgi:SAM-dependent methyltransferase